VTHSNVVQFPAGRETVTLAAARPRCRGGGNSIKVLADPLLDRVESAPPGFQKLFLLRLEIMVNEFELDVERFASID
jgi:hypothetical protein